MSYAIIRIEKIKSLISVRRTLAHSFRSTPTPNADPELLKENKNFFSNSFDAAYKRFQSLLPDKRRSDAVLMCEYITTASPEFFEAASDSEVITFFKASLQFLIDKHGRKNIVLASVHFDESTPHMHTYVVPNNSEGRLCCKSFFGAQGALGKLQDDFYSFVSKYIPSLRRGIKNTKIKHTDRKEFAQLLNTSLSIDAPTCEPLVIDKAMLRKAAVGLDAELNAFVKDYEAQRKKRDDVFEEAIAIILAQLADFKKKHAAAEVRLRSVSKLEHQVAALSELESARGALTRPEAISLLKAHSQLVLKERYSTPLIAGKPIPACKPEQTKSTAWENIKAKQPFEKDDGGYGL